MPNGMRPASAWRAIDLKIAGTGETCKPPLTVGPGIRAKWSHRPTVPSKGRKGGPRQPSGGATPAEGCRRPLPADWAGKATPTGRLPPLASPLSQG
jgi:hypothetical protein